MEQQAQQQAQNQNQQQAQTAKGGKGGTKMGLMSKGQGGGKSGNGSKGNKGKNGSGADHLQFQPAAPPIYQPTQPYTQPRLEATTIPLAFTQAAVAGRQASALPWAPSIRSPESQTASQQTPVPAQPPAPLQVPLNGQGSDATSTSPSMDATMSDAPPPPPATTTATAEQRQAAILQGMQQVFAAQGLPMPTELASQLQPFLQPAPLYQQVQPINQRLSSATRQHNSLKTALQKLDQQWDSFLTAMREHYQLAKTRYNTNRASLETSLRASQIEVDTATEQLKAIASAATTDPYMAQDTADSPMGTADEEQDASAQQDQPEGNGNDLHPGPSTNPGPSEQPMEQQSMPAFEVPSSGTYRKAQPSRSPTRPTPYTQTQESSLPATEETPPIDDFQRQILEAQQAAAASGASGEVLNQVPNAQQSPTEPASAAPMESQPPEQQTPGAESSTSEVFP